MTAPVVSRARPATLASSQRPARVSKDLRSSTITMRCSGMWPARRDGGGADADGACTCALGACGGPEVSGAVGPTVLLRTVTVAVPGVCGATVGAGPVWGFMLLLLRV